MSAHTHRIEVEPEQAGERADVILGRCVPGLSRRAARRLALAGKLRIDGARVPPSTRPAAGAVLELALEHEEVGDELPLELLHVGDHVIYVCKPAGLHTIALTPGQPGCLSLAVLAAFPECADASPRPLEAGAVHRLDRETSGVVAFARDRPTWEAARAGFTAHRIGKRYLAVVRHAASDAWPPRAPADALHGWLRECARLDTLVDSPVDIDEPAWELRAPLGAGATRGLVRVRLDGRNCCTRIQRVATAALACAGSGTSEDRATLLLVEPMTGSRHQIRAHLAWIGLPILGDGDYGHEGTDDARRLHLHAVRLDLSAAVPGEQPVVGPRPTNFWPPAAGDPPA